MNMLNHLWQPAKRLDRILPETNRMRRSKPNALKTLDFVNSLQQLNKRAFAVNFLEFVAPVQVDDLAQQSDFLNAACDQRTHLIDDLLERSAPLRATCGRNNAESAVHVAALHDRDEGSDLAEGEQMIANGSLRILFIAYVNDGKPKVVHRTRHLAFQRLINIFRNAVNFLRPDNDVEMRNIL